MRKLLLVIYIIFNTTYLILRRVVQSVTTHRPWTKKKLVRITVNMSDTDIWQFMVIAYIKEYGVARARINTQDIKMAYDSYRFTSAKEYVPPEWLLAHAQKIINSPELYDPKVQNLSIEQKTILVGRSIRQLKENKELADELWHKVRGT